MGVEDVERMPPPGNGYVGGKVGNKESIFVAKVARRRNKGSLESHNMPGADSNVTPQSTTTPASSLDLNGSESCDLWKVFCCSHAEKMDITKE